MTVDPFDSRRELQRLVEEAAGLRSLRGVDGDIRRLVEQYRTPYVATVEQITRYVNRDRELMESIVRSVAPPAFLSDALTSVVPISARSIFDSFANQQTQFQDYMKDAARAQTDAVKMVEGMFGTLRHDQDYVFAELRRIEALTGAFSRPASLAAVTTALGGIHDFVHKDADLFRSFVNPFEAALRSLAESANLLLRAADPLQAHAIEQSVMLTDAQVRSSEDLLGKIAAGVTGNGDDIAQRSRRLLVPRAQRVQIRRSAVVVADLDADTLLATIPVGQMVLVTREIVTLVADINEICASSGKPVIFRPTSRILRVVAELPFALAVDRESFADVIDDLYWLLYEAPGANSLRYLATNGGPLIDSDCDVVFVVKRLRNFFRHDPEHGSDDEIEKKLAAVRDDLFARGFETLPNGREAYQRLQRILVEEVLGFLALLRDSV
jgi:hypothetical protein